MRAHQPAKAAAARTLKAVDAMYLNLDYAIGIVGTLAEALREANDMPYSHTRLQSAMDAALDHIETAKDNAVIVDKARSDATTGKATLAREGAR